MVFILCGIWKDTLIRMLLYKNINVHGMTQSAKPTPSIG